jgi:two-component system, OmpR family, sensor kinase
MSIRLRLTLWYVALLSATLILFGGALYTSVRYSLYSDVDRTLQLRARYAVESAQFLLETQERAIRESQDMLPQVQPPPTDAFAVPDMYVEFRYAHGGVFDQSTNLRGRELPLHVDTFSAVRRGEPQFVRTEFQDQPVKILAQPIIYTGEVWGMVQVGRSLTETETTLRHLLFFIVIGIGVTLLLMTFVGAWLAERALAPVDAVTQAALRISRAEDLTRRLPPYRPRDEIGRLIAAFNEMLGHLDDVFRDQQRFVADVSHELRTPLTALQGNIDLLKRGALANPEEREEALETIESEVARLNRLVVDLLLLARADGGEQLSFQPVELDTLLLDIFRQARVLATSSNHPVRLRLGHEDQATVLGDPDRLKQLLLNLVDNAIKYTQEGEVVLSLWKNESAREVQISVQDTGIGIPRDALPLLFRRFYRTDKARSRQLGGTGLGLAIVEWIAHAHGGSIEVESEEGKGSAFMITLPLPSAEELAHAKVPTGSFRTVASASY